MTTAKMHKHVKRCAKAMAKAEWKRFVPQAEAHVQALMIDPNAAPVLEGRIKFKIKNHTGATA